MKVAVWDTYVKRTDGRIMHFDILVDITLVGEEQVYAFGREYLKSKSFSTGDLTSKECFFCHIERTSEEMSALIQKQGYSIIEMENCT